jgi:AraC-like DNA-binding protein
VRHGDRRRSRESGLIGRSAGPRVRGEWLFQTVSVVQGIAGALLDGIAVNVRDALIAAVPAPANVLEALVLDGFIARAQEEQHRQRLHLTDGGERDTASTLAERAAALIIERYAERWTISSIARALGTNRFTLTSSFVTRFGIGIHRYLVAVRVDNAKKRLLTRQDKVDAVARDVGFASRHALYAAHRRIYGTALPNRRRNPAKC